MQLLDLMIPGWISIIVAMLGAGWLGGILKDALNKWFLSRREKLENKSIDATTFGKTFDQGTVIYKYVQQELSRLVNHETEKLRTLISEKEIEHFEEITEYKRQVMELRKKVVEMQREIDELKVHKI